LPTRAKPFRCGIHGRGIDRLRRQEKANGVWAQCPVAVDCGEHALGFVENFGTWSGLSEEERDNLLNRRRRRRPSSSLALRSTGERPLA
jgi:Transcription factor WhiB